MTGLHSTAGIASQYQTPFTKLSEQLASQYQTPFTKLSEQLASQYQTPFTKLSEQLASQYQTPFTKLSEQLAAQYQTPFTKLSEQLASQYQTPFTKLSEQLAAQYQTPFTKLSEQLASQYQTPFTKLSEQLAAQYQTPFTKLSEQLASQYQTPFTKLSEQLAAQYQTPFTKLSEQLAAQTPIEAMRLRAFGNSARHLLSLLGADNSVVDEESIGFAPSSDARAFLAIQSASPEVADAIEEAAAAFGVPFWSRTSVRNALAWFLIVLIYTAYIAGSVLFPPWGPVAVGVLSASGVTAPAVHSWVTKGEREARVNPTDDN